jgi:hypothetical protein
MRLHSFQEPYLYIEEITAPLKPVQELKLPWEVWVKQHAPLHTSWVIYKIDLSTTEVLSCYCYARKSFLALSEESLFLPKLFALPLQNLSEGQRKRIGPAPEDSAADHRKVWNPQKIYQGMKDTSPSFIVQRALWPKDASLLAGQALDLYFDAKDPLFPFPYWIEIGDGYNTLHFQAIDSGILKASPVSKYPKAPPELASTTSTPDAFKIHLRNGSEFQSYQILATYTLEGAFYSNVIPYIAVYQKRDVILEISKEKVKQQIPHPMKIQLTVIPIEDPSLSIDITEPCVIP